MTPLKFSGSCAISLPGTVVPTSLLSVWICCAFAVTVTDCDVWPTWRAISRLLVVPIETVMPS